MIPAFVQQLGSTFNKSAGTTIALTTTGATTAGNLIVACILFDNFTTASKPIVSSIGKMAGETASWALLGAARSTSTSGGAFVSGEMWVIRTTVAWSAAAYTVTLDSSVTQKAVTMAEYSGALATTRSTTGTNYSTTTTAASASTTGTTPVTNDLALGMIIGSNVAAVQAGSNSTTAGSWSTPSGFGSTGASAATNNFGLSQYKVLTSGSHQTYANSAAMTAGNGAIVAILQAVPDAPITQAAYRFYSDGTESGSTALGTQDTAYSVDTTSGDVNLLLRVRMQASTTAIDNFDDFTLQVQKNAGAWQDVGATASIAKFEDTGDPTYGEMDANGEAWAESFLGTGQVVASGEFLLSRVGSPSGTVQAEIWASSAAWNSGTAIPTGTALETSATVSAASIPTTDTWTSFTFGSFTPTNGTSYFLAVRTSTADVSNYIQCLQYDAGGYAGSEAGYDSAWSSTSKDTLFRLNTTGAPVDPYNSANLTDAAATTNRLTGGSGTFVAGKVSEDSTVNDFGWTANNYTELLYSITVKQSVAVNGDVLQFRVVRNGATTGLTYTVTPTINITQTVFAATQAAYRFYADGTETGSTALAAQDTAYSFNPSGGDLNLQLRARLQSTNAASGSATDDYKLQVEKNASGTWVDLSAIPAIPPGVDESASAATITVPYDGATLVSAGQYNSAFTTETSEPDPWGTGGLQTKTVWWKYQPLTNGSVTFDTMQTVGDPYPDTMLALYTGPSTWGGFGSLTNVAQNDDNGTPPAPSLITYSVVAGTTYYIHCASWNGRLMTYVLSLTGARRTVHTLSIVPFDSSNLTDAAATTGRLAAGSGTFVAGSVSEDGTVDNLAITGNNYTELLFSLTLASANVTVGDTLRFRILRNGATTGMTYTQVPTINVSSGAPASLAPKNILVVGGPINVLQTYSR